MSRPACALCGIYPSSRKGEHVYPLWLVEHLFPPTEGPYTVEINGKPVARRNGTPRTDNHLPPLRLPACDEETGGGCNQKLSARFEQQATIDVVKAMFALGTLGANQALIAADWWLKTTLLAHHPHTISTTGTNPPVWDEPVDASLYRWMVDRSAPPSGISMWLAVARPPAGRGQPQLGITEGAHLDLAVYEVEGQSTRAHSADFGIARLRVHLLVHPGFEVEHPLEKSGHAVRLHPWARGELDLSTLLQLDDQLQHRWHHLWGRRIRLLLEPGFDPRESPWLLSPGWSNTLGYGLPGVIGAFG